MSDRYEDATAQRVPATVQGNRLKIILFANTDWYLYNFRRSLALALKDAGHEVLLLSPSGPYVERLLALGLRWQSLPMDRRSLNPLREMALLRHLWELFRRERPALVHGFTIKCAIYGSLAARLAGVPARIGAVAGLGYVFTSKALKARLLRPFVRGLLKLALGDSRSWLILQNPDDQAQFLQARLARPDSMRLIPSSGVDCNRFRPPDSKEPDASFRVLLPARLLWDKGVAEYVGAARLLRGEGRAVRFLLAGAPDLGNPAAVPEATVRAWAAEGVVEWLGHVDDMAALFAHVDAVVLPSYYREGVPRGLIEAAASGLPLITTDAPGCREAVAHEVNGLLVPVRDVPALAAAIARLQDEPLFAARLGAASRLRALNEFDERIVIARTLDVYREAVCST